jgi:MinD-like ATPase involved in chromosome partitioning or flagellar assembly
VVTPKGGAGRTVTTLALAAAFGAARGGGVLAWDNSEARGTLGSSVEVASGSPPTVTDLLQWITRLDAGQVRPEELRRYLRPQHGGFDALAGDEVPGRIQLLGGGEVQRLRRVLTRQYQLLVMDTGSNVRAPNWLAGVWEAGSLVVPTTTDPMVAESGLWLLDHVTVLNRPDLARNAVVVVWSPKPVRGRRERARLEQTVTAYRARVGTVIVVPFDRAVASPDRRFHFDRLAPATRRAWMTAGAAVVEALDAADQSRQRGVNR